MQSHELNRQGAVPAGASIARLARSMASAIWPAANAILASCASRESELAAPQLKVLTPKELLAYLGYR